MQVKTVLLCVTHSLNVIFANPVKLILCLNMFHSFPSAPHALGPTRHHLNGKD